MMATHPNTNLDVVKRMEKDVEDGWETGCVSWVVEYVVDEDG